MSKIIIFGNSIAYGAWDLEGGWVDRLRKDSHKKVIEEKKDISVYNRSISGAITQDVVDRFESEIKPIIRNEDTIVIFATGINDSIWMNNENKWRVSQEEFRNNLQKLIDLAKNHTKNIIYLGLTKTHDGDPITWATDKSYKEERVNLFNEILKEISEKNNISFLNLIDVLEVEDLADCVHPNTQGHEKIFKKVKEFLKDNFL
jgi:lysophospholipase L1-like esterase